MEFGARLGEKVSSAVADKRRKGLTCGGLRERRKSPGTWYCSNEHCFEDMRRS